MIILTPLQSGFIPGDSIIKQLTFLYDTFCKALDSGKEVRVVFCDISKAFDRVWHAGLIHKLRASGVSGNLLRWFENYLQNICQPVVCLFDLGLTSLSTPFSHIATVNR